MTCGELRTTAAVLVLDEGEGGFTGRLLTSTLASVSSYIMLVYSTSIRVYEHSHSHSHFHAHCISHARIPYSQTDTADCGEAAERLWRNDAQATARHAPHIRVLARLRTCGECTTSSVAQAREPRWTVNRVYQHPAPALNPGQSQTRHPAPPPLQDPYSHSLIIPLPQLPPLHETQIGIRAASPPSSPTRL